MPLYGVLPFSLLPRALLLLALALPMRALAEEAFEPEPARPQPSFVMLAIGGGIVAAALAALLVHLRRRVLSHRVFSLGKGDLEAPDLEAPELLPGASRLPAAVCRTLRNGTHAELEALGATGVPEVVTPRPASSATSGSYAFSDLSFGLASSSAASEAPSTESDLPPELAALGGGRRNLKLRDADPLKRSKLARSFLLDAPAAELGVRDRPKQEPATVLGLHLGRLKPLELEKLASATHGFGSEQKDVLAEGALRKLATVASIQCWVPVFVRVWADGRLCEWVDFDPAEREEDAPPLDAAPTSTVPVVAMRAGVDDLSCLPPEPEPEPEPELAEIADEALAGARGGMAKLVNWAESKTGLDLDGDGDVGVTDDDGKGGESSPGGAGCWRTFASKLINWAEQKTGLDLDGDGDVGVVDLVSKGDPVEDCVMTVSTGIEGKGGTVYRAADASHREEWVSAGLTLGANPSGKSMPQPALVKYLDQHSLGTYAVKLAERTNIRTMQELAIDGSGVANSTLALIGMNQFKMRIFRRAVTEAYKEQSKLATEKADADIPTAFEEKEAEEQRHAEQKDKVKVTGKNRAKARADAEGGSTPSLEELGIRLVHRVDAMELQQLRVASLGEDAARRAEEADERKAEREAEQAEAAARREAGAEAPAALKGWSCEACLVHNSAGSTACSGCGSPAHLVGGPPPAGQAAASSGSAAIGSIQARRRRALARETTEQKAAREEREQAEAERRELGAGRDDAATAVAVRKIANKDEMVSGASERAEKRESSKARLAARYKALEEKAQRRSWNRPAPVAQKAAAPARYGVRDDAELQIVKEIATHIYQSNNSAKVEVVDDLMAEWEGEERLLLAKLKAKYLEEEDEASWSLVVRSALRSAAERVWTDPRLVTWRKRLPVRLPRGLPQLPGTTPFGNPYIVQAARVKELPKPGEESTASAYEWVASQTKDAEERARMQAEIEKMDLDEHDSWYLELMMQGTDKMMRRK